MITVSALQKELTARRTALALMVEIPDIAAYAIQWKKLGADFDAAGWKNNAAICYSNAERYGKMDAGEYQRQLEAIPVSLEKVEIRRWDNPNERILPCVVCKTDTKHVRLTSGWMCGCGEFIAQYEFVEWEKV
jgi:hypothetical protein